MSNLSFNFKIVFADTWSGIRKLNCNRNCFVTCNKDILKQHKTLAKQRLFRAKDILVQSECNDNFSLLLDTWLGKRINIRNSHPRAVAVVFRYTIYLHRKFEQHFLRIIYEFIIRLISKFTHNTIFLQNI